MTNLIVKILLANKYWMFGISFVVCISSIYLMVNTPIEKIYLNLVYFAFGTCAAPLVGWNIARITGRD